MNKGITNVAASVRDRLLNRARAENRPFNELLQYYVIERFLYRLSRSQHASHFVLKGALMIQVWGGHLGRSTKDIDLLGRSDNAVESVEAAIRDCLQVEVEDDGVRFDVASIEGKEIVADAEYVGARIRFLAFVGEARLTVQVDVGFGDAIVPAPEPVSYPTLLDFEAPQLMGYPPESTIAEKLQAMVALDRANSRMKDFFDLWLLARDREFEGKRLVEAIRSTFDRRDTPVPEEAPFGLSEEFAEDPLKQTQWNAFLRKTRIAEPPPELGELIALLHEFLMPPLRAASRHESYQAIWSAGGPWKYVL